MILSMKIFVASKRGGVDYVCEMYGISQMLVPYLLFLKHLFKKLKV